MSFPDGTIEQVRDLARSHLRMFGVLDDSPTDIQALLDGLGIRLISAPCWEEPNWRGMAITTDGGYRGVLVNSLLHPTQQILTIAHEVGHIVMEHRLPRTQLQEQLADIYAAEAVMPRERILRQIHRFGNDVEYLADLNGVSVQAINQRLRDLSIVFADSMPQG